MEDNSEYAMVSSSCNIEENIEKDYEKSFVESLLVTLNDREQEIIKLLYGINEVRELSIDEVADKLNMSRERVRQLKFAILDKLKKEMEELRIAI